VIILDTNVISEMMRPSPASAVLTWLRARPLSDLATTSINIAEIRYGLARMSFGRRRSALETTFAALVSRIFGPRIFDFDRSAAELYGDIVAARDNTGRPLQGFDGLIAAIARSRALSVATRNQPDFEGCGIELVDPWEASVC